MPIDCRIDEEDGIVYTTLTGEVDEDEIVKALSGIITSPSYRPGLDGLVDLRGHNATQSSAAVRRIAELMTRHHAEIGHSRAALVVSDELGFGLARMYQAFAQDSSIETRIFYELAEANDWLGLSDR